MKKSNRSLIVISNILFLCSCAGMRVVETEVRVGELIDNKTGYFAYTTPLPPRDPKEVYLELALKEKLQGEVNFDDGKTTKVYPWVSYKPERSYLSPEILELCVPKKIINPPAAADTLELGYFMNLLYDFPWDTKPINSDLTKGLKWQNKLSNKQSEKIQIAIKEFISYAASIGAHAILDLAIFSTDVGTIYGSKGVYLTGRVIAIGKLSCNY